MVRKKPEKKTKTFSFIIRQEVEYNDILGPLLLAQNNQGQKSTRILARTLKWLLVFALEEFYEFAFQL